MRPWRTQRKSFSTAVVEVGGPEVCACTGEREIERAQLIAMLPEIVNFLAEVEPLLPGDMARRASELLKMAGEEVAA